MRSDSVAWSAIGLTAVAFLAVYPIKQPVTAEEKLVVKGTAIVTGPSGKLSQATREGRQVVIQKGDGRDVRIEEVKLDREKVTFQGATVDLNSPEVRDLVQKALESATGTVNISEKEARRVEVAGKDAKAAEVVTQSRIVVADPSVSFEYSSKGKAPVKLAATKDVGQAREVLAVDRGEQEWEGTITKLKTTSKALAPFDGATIRLKGKSEILEADVAGVARAKTEFVATITK